MKRATSARFSVIRALAISLFLYMGNSLIPVFANDDLTALECAPAVEVIKEIRKSKPDAIIGVMTQFEARLFISGIHELAKAETEIPIKLIDSMILVWTKGEKTAAIGVVVGDQVCESFQIPIELAQAIFKRGGKA